MKIRTALLAVIVILASHSATGQKFSYGIKAGLNIANQQVSNGGGISASFNAYYGFHAGIYTIFGFNDKLGLQPEAIYSAQGWDFNIGGVVASLRANYVNLPILLRYMPESKFHLDTGPQIGILVSADGTASGTTQDVSSYYSRTEIAWVIGAGVDLSQVTFSARYNLGLSDADTESQTTSKNNVAQFSIGYKLGSR